MMAARGEGGGPVLDLDIVGAVRDLTVDEPVVNAPVTLKRLRDSHHAVARLLAHGLTPLQVSIQTGYSPSRISILQRDPTFRELLAEYSRETDTRGVAFEYQMELVAKDVVQEIHERIQDAPESVSMGELHDIGKLLIDRAGYAPVARSVSKSMVLNVGDRMDAARRRLGLAEPAPAALPRKGGSNMPEGADDE